MDRVDACIKKLNDDKTTIYMIDSKVHMKNILSSEKAFVYKMKIDAIKYQGKNLWHLVPQVKRYTC